MNKCLPIYCGRPKQYFVISNKYKRFIKIIYDCDDQESEITSVNVYLVICHN